MKWYITSRGRPTHQPTFAALSQVLRPRDLRVVLYEHEVKEYLAAGIPNGQILVRMRGVERLGPTRQWLLERHAATEKDQRMVLLDDDLGFCARRDDDPTKARAATTSDLEAMTRALGTVLKDYVHAGILGREGANRQAGHILLHVTRMMRVLGYRARDVMKAGARFDRGHVLEDFDMTLQLLRAGYENVLLCDWWQGQGTSNAPGGCSTYRTLEMQAESARRLAELHPGFVKVVQRTTKAAWGGGTRTDVQMAWKKAYEEGLKNACR